MLNYEHHKDLFMYIDIFGTHRRAVPPPTWHFFIFVQWQKEIKCRPWPMDH